VAGGRVRCRHAYGSSPCPAAPQIRLLRRDASATQHAATLNGTIEVRATGSGVRSGRAVWRSGKIAQAPKVERAGAAALRKDEVAEGSAPFARIS